MKEGEEDFFFEKKKQKTFTSWDACPQQGHVSGNQKFFGSFFHKRTSFFF